MKLLRLDLFFRRWNHKKVCVTTSIPPVLCYALSCCSAEQSTLLFLTSGHNSWSVSELVTIAASVSELFQHKLLEFFNPLSGMEKHTAEIIWLPNIIAIDAWSHYKTMLGKQPNFWFRTLFYSPLFEKLSNTIYTMEFNIANSAIMYQS